MRLWQFITKAALLLVVLSLILVTVGEDAVRKAFAQDKCGLWGLASNGNKETSQDGKMSVKLISPRDSECEGQYALTNETGITYSTGLVVPTKGQLPVFAERTFGGYTLELVNYPQDAEVRVLNANHLLEVDLLIPDLPIDVKVEPKDPAKAAYVLVQGRMTMNGYVADLVIIAIKAILSRVFPASCVIPHGAIAISAQRLMNILSSTSDELANGNFTDAFNEFSKAFPTFVETLLEEGAWEGFENCVSDPKAVAGLAGQKLGIFMDITKWLVPWYTDYFKGETSTLTLSYKPDSQPALTITPIVSEIPTPTPNINLPHDASDPNYVYEQVKKAIKYKDVSFLEEFYDSEHFQISGSRIVACQINDDWVVPPIEIIEEHMNSELKCEGILFESRKLSIFYSGWNPDWIDCTYSGNISDIGAINFYRTEIGGNFKLAGIGVWTIQGANARCCGHTGIEPYNEISCDTVFIPDIEQAICPGALPQRLKIGDKGTVCPSQGYATVHNTLPGDVDPSSPLIGQTSMSFGSEFEVMSGPYCVGDGLSWFEVWPTGKGSGYMAEGGNEEGEYALCPLDSNLIAEVTPDPVISTPAPTPPGPDPRVDYTDMVYVPAGEFHMGCDPNRNAGRSCDYDEEPLHGVYLDAFFIDKYEVTNQQYAECVKMGACRKPYIESSNNRSSYFGDPEYSNYPVTRLDIHDAEDYCSWWGKRLPTEAEWEKAARGTTPRVFPWGDEMPDCSLANFGGLGNCFEDTTAVGSFPAGASPYGVMDMAGNVEEWVSDCYYDYYYVISPYENPIGPSEIPCSHVSRGGSWESRESDITTSIRFKRGSTRETTKSATMGFRCVADGE